MGSLPGWARLLVAVAAVPGIVLGVLSLVVLLVSILALLLLALPAYRLLRMMTGRAAAEQVTEQVVEISEPVERKQVQGRIVD
jgi:uncharacterized protein (DUF58 family)